MVALVFILKSLSSPLHSKCNADIQLFCLITISRAIFFKHSPGSSRIRHHLLIKEIIRESLLLGFIEPRFQIRVGSGDSRARDTGGPRTIDIQRMRGEETVSCGTATNSVRRLVVPSRGCLLTPNTTLSLA